MTNNKQPEIRFSGFTEDWEQRKLSELVSVMDGDRGNNYPSSDDFTEEGHTLFLSATNVTKYGFSFEINQYITEKKSNALGNGKLENNDIILTSRGSLGNIAWYNNEVKTKIPHARINSGMLILRSNDDVEASYIAQYLKSPLGKRQIDFISFGSAQPQLTKRDVSNYKIRLPDKQEQAKLGLFFTNIDDTIALHQQELTVLKETKQGFLQKMFPKEGEKVPEIRFPGFTDDWEQRKLREYTQLITKGTTPKDRSGKGDVNFVKVENLSNGKIRPIMKIDLDEHEGYLKRSRLEEDDILFSIAGTLGRTSIVNKLILPANTNQALAIIRGYNFDTNFLITSLSGHVVTEYIRKNPTVGAQPNLSLEQVGNLGISTPSILEQQKIGTFFKQLDDTIALHQRELDLLKETKKAFLQKMFV